jgi:NADPH:quinone reductase-like Zn-dependent oxidoreductase
VQIAKACGAEVTGVDGPSKAEMLRSIGADHFIDYTREDFTRNGERYDVLLDMAALIAAGQVVPVIDRCYPLAEAGDALRRLGEKQSLGKVLVTP